VSINPKSNNYYCVIITILNLHSYTDEAVMVVTEMLVLKLFIFRFCSYVF